MRYYIISGEASGDLHASNLIKEIKKIEPGAQFRAWGGDLMAEQGAEMVKHIRELAFMGFKEVISNLGAILKNIRFCKEDILEWKPDVVIFVDYPGFNLRICRWAKEHGFSTIYYISPQLWAWKENRVKIIKRYADKMLVILPFEKEFYDKHHIEADYVGHPLLDVVSDFAPVEIEGLDSGKTIIALLPGSRKQEISLILPEMIKAAEKFPPDKYQFVIAAAPSIENKFYDEYLEGKNVNTVFGKTYSLLKNACAALVTSGTATLETALFGVPEVVCYKGGKISFWLAKRLVHVKFISLVNLVMYKLIVKELIQNECTPENIADELKKITEDAEYRSTMIRELNELRAKLGGKGASERAANIIVSFLRH